MDEAMRFGYFQNIVSNLIWKIVSSHCGSDCCCRNISLRCHATAASAATAWASAATVGPTNLRKQFVSADRKIATIYRVNKVKHSVGRISKEEKEGRIIAPMRG